MSINAYLSTLNDVQTLHHSRDVTAHTHNQLCWIVLNLADRSVNVFHLALLEQTNQLLTLLEQRIAAGSELRGIVFCSAKNESFVAGADITALYPQTDKQAIRDAATAGQQVFNRIEALRVPTLAAINGACLGAGLELALACTYRVCSDNAAKVQLGLPEVKLGLLPGAGGTVRLPRLIGTQAALSIILPGGAVRPDKARRLGLVDAVLPGRDEFKSQFRFYNAVRDFANTRLMRPRSVQNKSWSDWLLDDTRFGHLIVSHQAVKGLDKMTKGHYAAPYYALDSTLNAQYASTLTDSLKIESANFGILGNSVQSKGLMSLFFLTEQIKDVRTKCGLDKNTKIASIQRVGVIGAGVMGWQIAALLLAKGKTVYLRDLTQELVTKGLDSIKLQIVGKVKKGRLTDAKAAEQLTRLTGGSSLEPFAQCDMLIEAAVERMDLKKKILMECEFLMREDCFFATNTSSLSISELAQASKRPENVVGLHFFVSSTVRGVLCASSAACAQSVTPTDNSHCFALLLAFQLLRIPLLRCHSSK